MSFVDSTPETGRILERLGELRGTVAGLQTEVAGVRDRLDTVIEHVGTISAAQQEHLEHHRVAATAGSRIRRQHEAQVRIAISIASIIVTAIGSVIARWQGWV